MSVEANATSSKKIEQKKNKRKKCKLSTHDEKNESFKDESNMLTYDVLRVIFSYLPAHDLCNCSQICRLWHDVATFELSIRKVIIRFGAYKDLFEKQESNEIFEQSIRNKPMLNLFFFPSRSPDNPSKGFEKYFPSNCYSIGIQIPGLVVENKEYEDNKRFSSYLLLPDDPSVDIDLVVFYPGYSVITNRKRQESKSIKDYEDAEEQNDLELFEKTISKLENPECLILLCNNDYDVGELSIANLSGIKSVWGGVVDGLIVINDKSEPRGDPFWLGLIISGKYVKTWSTFLDHNDVNEKNIRNKLMKLKDNLQLYKHTIGFMFSCNERGAHWYKNRKNVESSVFKNIFPEIPLIGCFGNGEFGNCNINANPNCDTKKNEFYREYSTTFMILTYGKINESLKIDDDN